MLNQAYQTVLTLIKRFISYSLGSSDFVGKHLMVGNPVTPYLEHNSLWSSQSTCHQHIHHKNGPKYKLLSRTLWVKLKTKHSMIQNTTSINICLLKNSSWWSPSVWLGRSNSWKWTRHVSTWMFYVTNWNVSPSVFWNVFLLCSVVLAFI
jgi:hypothetical protein